MKKTFWFVFWLLVGLILGSLLASVCAGVPMLRWLAYGKSISLSPAADLVILRFNLSMVVELNIAEILCVLAAMFCYHNFKW